MVAAADSNAEQRDGIIHLLHCAPVGAGFQVGEIALWQLASLVQAHDTDEVRRSGWEMRRDTFHERGFRCGP